MLRTNIISLTLLVICTISAGALPCPAPNYLGNIYSGTPIIIQLKSSQHSMVALFQFQMDKTHNATIIVYLMHLIQSLILQFQFIVSKQSVLIIYSSLLNLSELTVSLLFHL
jgi:hypothetical protein